MGGAELRTMKRLQGWSQIFWLHFFLSVQKCQMETANESNLLQYMLVTHSSYQIMKNYATLPTISSNKTNAIAKWHCV